MISTSSHLDRASEALELAITEYFAAKLMAENFGWSQEHIERIDLLKRATAKVKADMLADAEAKKLQEELVFG